jgi:hypothetical protein
MRRRQRARSPLIKIVASTPVDPKTSQLCRWDEVRKGLESDLDRIVAGQDMPTSRSAQNLMDHDRTGELMRICCSDEERSDSPEYRSRRKRNQEDR